MATTTWQKVASDPDGFWSDAAHWDPGVPQDGDTVVLPIISGKPAYTITLDVDTANIAAITIAQPKDPGPVEVTLAITSHTLNLTGSGNVLTAGHITIAGGTINSSGGLALASGSDLIGWGTLNVSGLYTGTGTMQASGGVLDVFGTVVSGVVLSIGSAASSTLKIENGATLAAAVSITNGNQTLEIGSSGNLTINAEQSVTSGTIQLDGGSLTDASGITIGTGAHLTGAGTITAGTSNGSYFEGVGSVTASGGILDFVTRVDTTTQTAFDIESGATLKFEASVGASGVNPVVTFDSGANTLDLSLISSGAGSLDANFFGQIAGFTFGDGIKVAHATSVALNGAHTQLMVFDGGSTLGTITFTAAINDGYFSVSGGNTIVELVCFMPGTLISTPDGARSVETFMVGDLVLTTEGRAVPVRWIGRQTVSRVFGDPMRVLPIRITANALGDNLPIRDLLLSPDHALLIDGVLVHAGALVNGATVRRESDVPPTYTYYHLELDDHSLILAEGVAAETFVDNIDRLAFDNWDEHEAFYPQGKPIVEMDYPRAKAYRQVPRAIRERLARRGVQ
jgi:hypothetical protein